MFPCFIVCCVDWLEKRSWNFVLGFAPSYLSETRGKHKKRTWRTLQNATYSVHSDLQQDSQEKDIVYVKDVGYNLKWENTLNRSIKH
jgi:hypothetical protein